MTNKDFNKIIAQRIISLRKQYKLKMEQLAYQSGISKGGLSEIERGIKDPRTLTLAKICSGFGISLDEFFNFSEIKNFINKL